MWDMSRPGPQPDVKDGELVTAIESREQPFATAGDVAEIVGLSRWRTSQRLKRLADEGDIKHGKVGERTTIYWLESD
jgi:DNA-binding Lrp family transcriptional regulator